MKANFVVYLCICYDVTMKKVSSENQERVASLAHELRVIIGNLRRQMRKESNHGDLSWSEIAVLGHIDRDGPATVTALAKAERVRSQSMGATLSTLEQQGLVSRSQDPVDGRQTIFSLTAKCLEWIRSSRAEKEDSLHNAIQTKLNPTEQEELASAIKLLKRLIQP